MSNNIVAFLALGIIGGLGLVFVGISFLVKISTRSKISKCTEVVNGQIVKHSFPGDSRIRPVVEYIVNGKKYRTVKKYNGFRKIRHPLPVKDKIWEDKNGYLYVKNGPAVNTKKLANEMWPIGSTMKVFYFANNPKINYVDRPIYNRFLINVFMFSGIGLIGLGCIMYIFIR